MPIIPTLNIEETQNFIWRIADKLRGAYHSDKYKDVIIPMVILRRFECALEKTKPQVLQEYQTDKDSPLLKNLSGYSFYNTSKFDLKELLNDQTNIKANLENYISGFSENIKDIFNNLEFQRQIDKMYKENCLYSIVKAFSELDLDPQNVPNHTMGYIFEDLIRRFSENAEAGDHYTGRDIIKLMVEILLSDVQILDFQVIHILDQACGTGGMLSMASEVISNKNKNARICLYGQEINGESYAICKADMLIKGENENNIKKADSLKEDKFANEKFDFVIENPPFGTPWGGDKAKDGVEKAVFTANENKTRFIAGLPSKSDAQLLFLQSALEKIKDNGKVAIIQNGSPLFSGETLSGESQIRKYLLENDFIDSIIALPTDLFYNTNIATYIWILRKQKPQNRKGKVALIDASGEFVKLRKAMGNKRNELSQANIENILQIYQNFCDSDICKIYENSHFMYKEFFVMTPLQKSYCLNAQNLLQVQAIFQNQKSKSKKNSKNIISDQQAQQIISTLSQQVSEQKYLNKKDFVTFLKDILVSENLDAKTIDKIAAKCSQNDPEAEIQTDNDGNIIYDKDSKDSEIININVDIAEYMQNQVLPHLPNAISIFDDERVGAEIAFTRYFYRYQTPNSTEEIKKQFLTLQATATELESEIFDE